MGSKRFIIAIVTSNIRIAGLPGNVAVPPTQTGLPKESVVNVSQLVTVDHCQLVEYSGNLSSSAMSAVDAGLRLSIGL